MISIVIKRERERERERENDFLKKLLQQVGRQH